MSLGNLFGVIGATGGSSWERSDKLQEGYKCYQRRFFVMNCKSNFIHEMFSSGKVNTVEKTKENDYEIN